MSQVTTQPQPQPASQPFVAHSGKTYRRYRYVMFVLMVGFGLAFLYDGFFRWPGQNKAWDEMETTILLLEGKPRDLKLGDAASTMPLLKSMSPDLKVAEALATLRATQKGMPKHHTDFDLQLQRVLGFALPPVAGCFLVLWLRRSRGEYRLENDTLYVPGFPPIPLTAISSLDKTRWDRKGIAFASYHLPNGKTGSVRLDDFIYEAYPIRDMVKCIEESILARARAQQTPPVQ